jgi:hypothetical protein
VLKHLDPPPPTNAISIAQLTMATLRHHASPSACAAPPSQEEKQSVREVAETWFEQNQDAITAA